VLTFFIAGLLFICASEHVDNLGAYTASRPETGLLIPSVKNTYASVSRIGEVIQPNETLEFDLAQRRQTDPQLTFAA
jgi:hypothetical protein